MPERAGDVEAVLRELEARGSASFREQLEPRYGIVARKAFGTPMAEIKRIARSIGRDHELAGSLWGTGWYEARLLCSLIDDPAQVTPEQMDRWRGDFDNWAVVDTLCFNLFDRTPHALTKIREWAELEEEFGRRAAYALLAAVALHRKELDADTFLSLLPVIERAATDERNFVKKGVSWALRAVGSRKDPAVRTAALDLAERLAAEEDRTARWIGRDALRTFRKAKG